MTEKLSGWKILSKDRRSLVIRKCDVVCNYPVGEPTRPREHCGPLTVFKDEESAHRFIASMKAVGARFLNKHLIVRCEYTESKSTEVSMSSATDGDLYHRISLDQLPSGSALADEVVCLE